MLRVLDLFSGIGGFSLGLERTGGFRTVAFCEIEPFPRKVLAKHWPNVPIFEDMRKLHAEDLPEPVDVICGGFPCQPFSLAGKRKGAEDDRHLWPEIDRLLREFDAIGRKPSWCLFENVAGHVNMGLDQVLSDLEGQGYTTWPLVIPACGVDAPHRRDRVWIIANDGSNKHQSGSNEVKWKTAEEFSPHTNSDHRHARRPKPTGQQRSARITDGGDDVSNSGYQLSQIRSERERNRRRGDVEQHGCIVADTTQQLFDRCGRRGETWRFELTNGGFVVTNTANARFEGVRGGENKASYWQTEPDVGRVANGVPSRVDRLKSLGNAVVPAVVTVIGNAILEAHYGKTIKNN